MHKDKNNMKLLDMSIWIMAVLLTLYLFSNFSEWVTYLTHPIENEIAGNGDRLFSPIPPELIGFFFACVLLILPILIAKGIYNVYKKRNPKVG